jgi:hypothetical protein
MEKNDKPKQGRKMPRGPKSHLNKKDPKNLKT